MRLSLPFASVFRDIEPPRRKILRLYTWQAAGQRIMFLVKLMKKLIPNSRINCASWRQGTNSQTCNPKSAGATTCDSIQMRQQPDASASSSLTCMASAAGSRLAHCVVVVIFQQHPPFAQLSVSQWLSHSYRLRMQYRPFRIPKQPVWEGETACSAGQYGRGRPATRLCKHF